MVTTTLNSITLPSRWSKGNSIPLRFGSGVASLAKVAGSEVPQEAVVRGYRFASFIKNRLLGGKLFNNDIRWGGLSLEDMASRVQTLLGVYLLQGYYAIKDDKHPWETNGRNAVIWVMTLLLQNLAKSENYGVNTLLFNPFMRQKGYLSSEMSGLQKFLDHGRMDVDYLDILQDAGIKISDEELKGARKGKKALWASSWLDANKTDLIKKRYRDLHHKIQENAKAIADQRPLPHILTPLEEAIEKEIPRFFKRINGWNMASTALLVGATIYFIGGVAMDIVNKVISPLDKDFEGNKNLPPDQILKNPILAKTHPPQSTFTNNPFPSNPSSITTPPIQFFQSYVSHRRHSSPSALPGFTLPGGPH